MNKNLQWHLLALCANVLWGLMAPIGKSALAEFSPLAVTTFRMVGGAACFWLLSMCCKKEHVNHRDLLTLFFAALFALVFNQGVYIFGLSLTSPVDASIVTTTLPIVTMIIAALYLKEPVTGKKVLGIFSGAMGTLIQQYGLAEEDFRNERLEAVPGLMKGNNDMLCLTRSDVIADIHRRYLEAGADIITTNTFNATRVSQSDYHTEAFVQEINLEAARLARGLADRYTALNPQ